jgi:glycosyltransferase involved in cell wall biosynthesis
VSTSVGGLSELVDPAAGRLVPPEDPSALAAAIVEVIATPGLADSMGRAASSWVAEAGWESVAHLSLEAYRRYGLV